MAKTNNNWSRIVAELEIQRQTDRGAAIIACAILEDSLKVAIDGRLYKVGKRLHKDLFKGIFGGFRNRTNVARSLGLINDDIRRDLVLIGEIRNMFGHWETANEKELSFDTPLIVKKCGMLLSPVDLNIAVVKKRRTPSTPRDQYLDAAQQIHAWLMAEVKNSKYTIKPYRWEKPYRRD